MTTTSKLKSVDIYRGFWISKKSSRFKLQVHASLVLVLKSSNLSEGGQFFVQVPGVIENSPGLTEATLSGAGLTIVAALAMVFLFGMGIYLAVDTTTSTIVDKSSDGEFIRIEFNISFPALSCKFASVDVSDVLGTSRLNIMKTTRKFSIDPNLRPTGAELHSGLVTKEIKHNDESNEEHEEGSVFLNIHNFDKVSHQHDILLVNFFAPWCYWSNRLKPSWDKAAKIIREKYDPEIDGRISLAKVDCTVEVDLCRRNHIQGYPSIRIFRKGSDVRDEHGHETYYGDRDTDSLVEFAEGLVAPIP